MEKRKGRLNAIEITSEGTIRKIGIIREKSRPYRLKVEAWVLQQLNLHGFNVPKVLEYYQTQEGKEVLTLERLRGKRLSQIMDKKNAYVMYKVGSQLSLLKTSINPRGWGWIDPTSMTGKFNTWHSFLSFYVEKYGNLLKNRGTLSEKSVRKILNSLDMIELEEIKPVFVHRDVKPSNILIDENGKVWILDWENTIIGDQLFDLAAFGARYGEGIFWENFAKGLRLEQEVFSPQYKLYKVIALIGVIDFCQKYGLKWKKFQLQLQKFIQQI